MRTDKAWSNALLKLSEKTNNFNIKEACTKGNCIPFYIGASPVGVIAPSVLKELVNYRDVFTVSSDDGFKCLHLNEELSTVEERSQAVDRVLRDLRDKKKFVTLAGWRNETYGIYYKRGEAPLCHIERAGCSLFGLVQYGAHINGYTVSEGEVKMWVGRRSKTKQTYPDMLDNMCAGGLASGLGVKECAIKECKEEASVDDKFLVNLKPVGAISYCYLDHRGILPETEYVFDLELPSDFVPQNADGEMQNFQLYSLKEIQDLIIAEEFKPNCALVVVDFMIRHGFITQDNEPNYCYLIEKMHMSVQPPMNRI